MSSDVGWLEHTTGKTRLDGWLHGDAPSGRSRSGATPRSTCRASLTSELRIAITQCETAAGTQATSRHGKLV